MPGFLSCFKHLALLELKINFLFILFLLFVAEESKPETSKWGKLELEQTKRGGSATLHETAIEKVTGILGQ